jgi:hypothetical protein
MLQIVKAETSPFGASERDTLRDANERLSKLRHDEETKWDQFAKGKHV